METSHPSSLSLTLSWTSGGRRHSADLPLLPALRVAAALGLCALSYSIGGWRARLEAVAAAPEPAKVVAAAKKAPALPDRKSGLAPGHAVGEAVDVITPLNVRDPSALVMAPYTPPEKPPKAAKPRAKLVPEPPPHDGPDIRL